MSTLIPRPRSVTSSALSNAEQRVLDYLPTQMSFREIGEQLELSGDSVKWLAVSVYRKLGVVTRQEAVNRSGVHV
jgi:LuxR family maltose regulon positive regulatory protein